MHNLLQGKCEALGKIPLDEARSLYYAISYCAGDLNNTTSISVNGYPFSVFASLAHALRAVRCYFKGRGKEAEERFRIPLWADQICID